MVFLEILLSTNMAGFPRAGHIYVRMYLLLRRNPINDDYLGHYEALSL